MSGELFDNRPAPAIERLARIEGQSNFISLLAGIEAGPDTTQDVAALSFARGMGCIPEVLEAHYAKSELFKLPLMSLVFKAISEELRPDETEAIWIRGVVADAFFLLRDGHCNSIKSRAKSFRVNEAAYAAARSLASGVFNSLLDQATRKWYRALARETPGKMYGENTGETYSERQSVGHYVQFPLHANDGICEGHLAPVDTRGVCIADRLGWDEREASKSSPVTITPAQPTPPAQTKPDTGTDAP